LNDSFATETLRSFASFSSGLSCGDRVIKTLLKRKLVSRRNVCVLIVLEDGWV
jgi:hypothetical protein